MSYDLIKYLYEVGSLTLKDVAKQVDLENITEEEFHTITTYSYKAIKNAAESL